MFPSRLENESYIFKLPKFMSGKIVHCIHVIKHTSQLNYLFRRDDNVVKVICINITLHNKSSILDVIFIYIYVHINFNVISQREVQQIDNTATQII